MAKKLDRSYFEAQAAKPQTTRPQAASDTSAGSGTKKLDKSFFEVRAEEAKNRPVREATPEQGAAPAAETTQPATKRSFGSRLLSGIKSGLLSEGANLANAGGVQADRRGGTEMSGIYREQVSALDQQIAALENNLRDPSLSARQKSEAADALAVAKSQREIYAKAVESGKQTASGLYETADKSYSLAEKYGKESLDGTEGIERAALGAVPTVTQLGTQVAADLLAPGVGTIGRAFSSGGANAAEYRYQAGDDYDSQKAALRMALSAGGVAAGSALSGAVNASGLKLLRQLGKQNYVLPNIALGGASALGYAAGETGLTELSKAMTDEDYTPDWNAIGKTGLTAFAFGAITRAIDTARVSVGNKRYMKALNENVRERYNYAKRTIDDPRMAAQQKAQAANSVMDAADKMRYALDELQVVGAQKDVNAIREFLLSIYGDMMQYTNISSGGISGVGGIVPTAPSAPPSAPVVPEPPVQPTAPVPPAAPSPTAPTVAGRAAVTSAAPKTAPSAPTSAPQAQNAPETRLASSQERTEAPAGETTPREPKTQQSEAQELNTNAPADVKAAFDGGKILNEKAVDDAVRSGALESAFGGGIVQSKGRADIERFAKTMGKAGASVLSEQYRDGQDAEAYIRGMTKAYNAGKNGTSRAELINNLPSGIDGTQAQSAYIAGQADATSTQAVKSPLPEAAQSGTMESAKAAPTLTVSDLAERLKTNTVTEDGAFRYSVERKGGRFPVYVGSIREISGTDAYATDARAARYVSQNFKTYEEAVADLVAVARNSGFIKEDAYEQNRADGAGRSLRERGKEPDAAGNGTLPRSFGQSAGETGHLRGRYGVNDSVAPARGSVAESESRALSECGIESLVIPDGKWDRKSPAFTRGGKVYMQETIPEEKRGMVAPHETTHAMKQLGYKPYLDFVRRTAEYFDETTVFGDKLVKFVGKHRGFDSLPTNEADRVTFFDELNAIIYGHYASGKMDGLDGPLHQAFRDFDRYIEELANIHKQFKNRSDKPISPSGENGKAKPARAENPQQQIADDVRRSIERGIAFSSARLFEIADKAYGGTMAQGAYTVKDAYDGMELAVNQYLMHSDLVRQGNGNAANAKETLAKLQTLLWKLPTQTKRTAEMESFQQFSTPPNIAYLAAWTANVGAKDIVLEPSAGIGGLALWPKAWGATVYGNELSTRRLAFLNQLGLDGTYNLNAEQINNLLPDEIKPSVVLMNPPFSATAGRTATNKTANAKRHIEQALDRLEEGGRLVAILGNGMENDAPAFRAWWDDLRREYSVRANIRIDGENYKKYGTTFDVQLVVIDKTGPNQTPTITGTYKDLSKIPDLMEGIRNDRTRVEEHPAGVHTAVSGNGDADGSARGKLESKRSGTTPARSGGNDRGNAAGAAALDAGPRRGLQSRGDQGGVEQNAGGQELARAVGESGSADRPDSIQLERNGSTRPERVPDRRGAVKELAENPDSVYSTYSPSKVHIKGAKKHPAKLVESAAMGAVLPPDPTYTPALPARIAKEGILSDAQLENVVYAGQAHSQTLPDGRRRGYFIGDGTGVGKGRQLAGIIMDNYLQGRTKAVWVSEKTGLVNDARRDWSDLGGNKDAILDFSKYKLGQPIADKQGVMFTTYDTLKMAKGGKSRIDDLKAWLGGDFDGVIAFDEAHNMGGFISVKGKRGKTKPAAKAIAGVDLQKAFPNARIVYASATGATDITQYGYLDRLGLWGKGTAFNDVNDFISKISDGGLAAMELVARDMKAMGVYMARSISYDDVKYDTLQHDLTPMQTEIYNTMSRAWQKVLQNMNKALEVTGQSKDGMARGRAVGAFYSTQQRFYNQIITSMAMPSVIEDMRRELAAGRSCVLQLTNTNAAQADRALAKNEAAGGSLDDLDLTPSDTLIQMLEKSFPVELYEEYTDEDGKERSRPVLDKDGKPVLDKKAVQMRDNLIAELQQMKVPDGPLEMLLDAFGADNVAEVTGRTRRVVEKPDENGNMKRVVESRGAASGIADANMFQDGKKRILVFSDAGGTGRSYHADLRAKNQQQRVHYLLQPGWSASKAVQGFGRTHRSNQASAPIFRLVTTNVMGQKRFTSTIARRLDQLGALTKGQRQASGGVFGEKDNLENPIAMDALATFYKSADKEVLKKLGLYDKLFDEWGRINEGSPDLRDISKFLNRILSLEVDEQNATFQQFYDTFERMMDAAIANGTVDMGLENYRADKVEVLDETVIRKDPSGADTRYVQMKVYRKPELIPFSALDTKLRDFKGLVRLEDGSVRAVYEISSKTNEKGEIQRRFSLESPVRGVRSVYVESTLNEKTTKINKSEWAQAWKEETAKAPEYNESTLHLLTGTLLPIWNRLPANNTRVMRVVTSDGGQYLGRVIRPDQIDGVLRSFGANRTMQTYTPEQVSDLILAKGKEVVLRDNRVKLARRRVSGEWRTEISGTNLWFLQRQYPSIFSERINYEWRMFIPTGEAGLSVLRGILKDNPVVDVREPAPSGDVDANMVNNVRDPKDEWDAERIKGGEAKEKAKSISEIVEQIRHDFGTNITAGHIRGKRGQYDRATHGIRSKLVNDLPNIAHELGHHLDNTYDLRGSLSSVMRDELTGGLDDAARNSYPKKKWISEGIAEYFRKYLQNREVAAIDYPTFTAYIKNLLPAKDMAQLDQLADEVNAYYALDADTATSSVRLREEGRPDARTYDEKIKANADALYQAWVDSNHGIKLFDRATGADTYKLATNAAYSDAMAGQIIVGDLTDADGRYVSGGLKTALHGINLNDKEEYRLFGEYLIVRHGPERLAEGMRVFADDRKNSAEFMERRAAVLEQQHPKFKEAADRLYQFERDLRQVWGVDTGLIGEQTAKDWDERWKYYVPFNRAVSVERRGVGAKRGFANQKNPIKKAHGSGLDIVHPVDNIINNIVLMVNAGVRNNVMRKITDEARRLGADASLLEPVPTPMKKDLFRAVDLKKELSDTVDQSGMTAEDKMFMLDTIGNISNVLEQFSRGKAYGDVVTVMRGGEPEFWKINDPLLLSSITSLSPKSMNGILDAYAIVSRFMTSNITGMNLLWNIFSNMPRDFQTLLTYSKDKNVAHLVKAIGSAYVNKIKGSGADPLYLEYLAMGGGKTSAYTADRDLTRRARQQLTGEKKISLNPLDMIAYISDLIELGPRYATYKLMRERGMTPQEAFYEAMDITVNFRRGGIRAREVNKAVPFFNANVQGLDKHARWITAEDAPAGKRKGAAKRRFLMYLAASAALAAVNYGINNGSDENKKDYQQLSTYTKNSYWVYPIGDGKYLCLPKPRELAVLTSLFEALLERTVGGNEHAFDGFYEYATGNFLPSILSDFANLDAAGAIGSLGLIGVGSYMVANRDFLGRPIESTGMRYLEPRDRYNERTSKLAYWIGQAFDVSPVMVDYFFQNTLGGFWKAQKAIFPVGEENRDWSFGIQGSYIKDNQYSQDLTNWLYDQAEKSSQAKKSDPANMDKAIAAAMDDRMVEFYSSYNKLAKNTPDTVVNRGTRQTVLDAIYEYRKAHDHNITTDAERMAYGVCKEQGGTELLPSCLPVTVKDGDEKTHSLSASQYVEYQFDYNRLYWEYVEDMLSPSQSADERAAVLRAAKTVAKEEATNRILSELRAPKTSHAEKYEGVKAEDVAMFKAFCDLANDDGSLKQEEVINIIKGMNLSGEESYALFKSKYPKSDANNPWRRYR